jgi:hypothetical protein
MIGAQPLRMAAQQHQYVGVPAGERGAPQLTVLVGDLPSGAIGTQNDEACRSRRRVVGLGSGQAQQGQVVLTATTVARTSANVCGEATRGPPVRSLAPIKAPVSRSCTGTTVQLHGWTNREKCSDPRICSSRSRPARCPAR